MAGGGEEVAGYLAWAKDILMAGKTMRVGRKLSPTRKSINNPATFSCFPFSFHLLLHTPRVPFPFHTMLRRKFAALILASAKTVRRCVSLAPLPLPLVPSAVCQVLRVAR